MNGKDKAILILSGSCLVLLLSTVGFYAKWRSSIDGNAVDHEASTQLVLSQKESFKAAIDSIHTTYDNEIVALRDSFYNVTIPSKPELPKTSHGISGNAVKAAGILTDYFH